jgi:hypothetical protein
VPGSNLFAENEYSVYGIPVLNDRGAFQSRVQLYPEFILRDKTAIPHIFRTPYEHFPADGEPVVGGLNFVESFPWISSGAKPNFF